MNKPMKNFLSELVEIEQQANDIGFKWPNENMILEQISSEVEEIKKVIENNEGRIRLQEEIGDLLHAAISLCIFHKFNVEETIAIITKKFVARITALKLIIKEQNIEDLEQESVDSLLELWKTAKERAVDIN